jgi:CRISPR-associated protein Csd1
LIVDTLYNYYKTLLNDQDSGVSRPGYSKARVAYCLMFSREGQLLDIIDLRDDRRGKLVSRDIDVPEQIKRASNVSANFMCDNCTYVLGLNQKNKKENKKRIQQCFMTFVAYHETILKGVEDEGAATLLEFLHRWDIASAAEHPVVVRYLDSLMEGSNLVFKLEGSECYLHERKAIMDAWHRYMFCQSSDVKMQCLVTGRKTGIARLHPSIKGVAGAQSSGASLVSFNLDAFASYGRTQNFNAPVGEDAAFGYTTALNYLLRNAKHRIGIGGTTTVFWAERSTNGLEEDLLGALFNPEFKEESSKERSEEETTSSPQIVRDPQTVRLLHDIFLRIKEGVSVKGSLAGINENTNFFVLGLAPNASRLAVRFWHMDQFGAFVERVAQHYRDMLIMKRFDRDPDLIPIWMILKETAPLGDSKRVAPLLGGVLMRSILTGAPYPMSLYSSIIARIRADHEINYVRSAVIKAFLVRKQRFYPNGGKEELTVGLNTENRNAGYMLGRLFALLEKAQEDANPGINATIRDRYFGSASASPGSVFPILLRLVQHHISKAEWGWRTDRQIGAVMSDIDQFPTHLSLDDQGQFALGYYQQRQALYSKTEKKEDDE